MPKKRPASASQKGALPASSITPRSSASVAVAEAGAVQLHEQIAAAREQQPQPPARISGCRNSPPTSDEPSRSVVSVSVWLRKVLPSSGLVWVSVLRW